MGKITRRQAIGGGLGLLALTTTGIILARSNNSVVNGTPSLIKPNELDYLILNTLPTPRRVVVLAVDVALPSTGEITDYFYRETRQYARRFAEKNQWTIVMMFTSSNSALQIDYQAESLRKIFNGEHPANKKLDRLPSALVVAPVATDGLEDLAAELKGKGIPIVAYTGLFDPPDAVIAAVVSNNLQMARELAEVVLTAAKVQRPDAGEVIVLGGVLRQVHAAQRNIGFGTVARESGYGVVIMDTKWQSSLARKVLRTYRQAAGNFDGVAAILSAGYDMAEAASGYFNSINLGPNNRPLIGHFNASPDSRAMVQDGLTFAYAPQDLQAITDRSLTLIDQALNGTLQLPESDRVIQIPGLPIQTKIQ